jgi:predicted secreted hydrolase
MKRRRFFVALPAVATAVCTVHAAEPWAPVVPGRELRFPADEGSHPDFRLEWWYVTGWLTDELSKVSGFQVTFFRTRPVDTGANPSRFAPSQVFIAHVAVSDPQRGHLLHAERVARGAFGIADASEGEMRVTLDRWELRREGQGFRAIVAAHELTLDLSFTSPLPPLLQGDAGFSRKGRAPESASYYYSLTNLGVRGKVTTPGGAARVTGSAWLDHEGSSARLEPAASGWGWIGIYLDDGGALMVYRIRSETRANYWSTATVRRADGSVRHFAPQQIAWLPRREWLSSRSGALYPVSWDVRVDELVVRIEPLMNDQELDAQATTGTIYWEGAVTAQVDGREIGRGYLEMTGYWRPFRL